eukprot:gene9825-biopygen6775
MESNGSRALHCSHPSGLEGGDSSALRGNSQARAMAVTAAIVAGAGDTDPSARE